MINLLYLGDGPYLDKIFSPKKRDFKSNSMKIKNSQLHELLHLSLKISGLLFLKLNPSPSPSPSPSLVRLLTNPYLEGHRICNQSGATKPDIDIRLGHISNVCLSFASRIIVGLDMFIHLVLCLDSPESKLYPAPTLPN